MKPPRHRREQGMVLIAVLVVLVVTLLAGMSMMSAVQTGSTMAGNFSFRQSGMQAADRVLNDAMTQVANRIVGNGGNTDVANSYLAVIDTTPDARGAPDSVNWNAVACTDEKGAVLANCELDDGGYRVQYVVERRCSANPDFADIASIRAYCEYEPSAASVSADTIALRYRVVIRVRGPRGTESWFEAMVSGPASS